MFLSLGVSKDEFWDSTPKELQPYVDAHNLRMRRTDTQMWQMGIYTLNAVSVAVTRALHGRKAKSEYLEKPMYMLSEDEKNEAQMSDADRFSAWAMAYNKRNFDDGQEEQ